jgi:hypothetical protein
MCRDVAGGMTREAAWRAHGFGSRNSTRFFKRPAIAARVAELQAEFNEGSRISLAYLQERLLALTTGDVGNYLEKRPYSDKLRVKDITSLAPELRACISEVNVGKGGELSFKIYDKIRAIEVLLRSVGAISDANVDVAVNLGARIDAAITRMSPDDMRAVARALEVGLSEASSEPSHVTEVEQAKVEAVERW